jgi:hypothetical protein
VCFWEDDPVQILDPWYVGGANKVSLAEAQANFIAFGASEARFKDDVKKPRATTTRDPSWRLLDESDRKRATTPAKLQKEKPNDPWPWHYWEHDV